MSHICIRCAKSFSRKLALSRHMARKFPCKIINIDENSMINVDTDELLLNGKLTFPKLDHFELGEYMEPNKNYSIILAAIRRSGKTTLIEHWFPKLKKDFDVVFFISNSIHNKIYDFTKICIQKNIIRLDTYDEKLFKMIFKFQKKTNNLLKILLINR